MKLSSALDVANRVDDICDRFEDAWRAGRRPRIEDYLAGEDAATRPVLFRALLAVDLERRLKLGESPPPGEYLERFPDHAALVGTVLEELSRGAGGAGSGVSPGALTIRSGSPRSTSMYTDFGRELSAPAPEVPGYEILGELGRGGMGVVYRARELRLNRIVALKMILAGAHAGPESAVRFLNEAEVVARLRHPNIVQIYALGDHEGRPFVELEYVEGGNLARSLDGTPRTVSASAVLVEVIARAAHEAHRRGIIHRDLKPANVLLTADGQPKIADFGLAKAIGLDSGLTRSDLVLGSPSYMAPEQAEGHAKSVGVAADVYALGAIFYELLTGRPPFRAATALATLELVRGVEAVPPSRFSPDLPRDAETICLKCLEKDPAKRYPSAEALAEDLRRYLEGRPITARPVGPMGRLRRWCVREPKVAALVMTLALTFVSGFAGVAWAWRRAETERDAAVEARGRAEANFRKARGVVDELTTIAERLAGRPELDRTRREILEKIAAYHATFLEEKSEDPELMRQSALAYRGVASIRGELGQHDHEIQAYRRSGELFNQLLARFPSNPRYRSERAWSHFYMGVVQRQWKDAAESQTSFEKAIELMRGLVDAFPKEIGHRSSLALFLTNWGRLRLDLGDQAEAKQALEQAIELERDILIASPRNLHASRTLALALHNFSTLLTTPQTRVEAESMSREAVTLLRYVIGEQKNSNYLRPYLARYQSRLASILERTGRAEEAESWRRRGFDDVDELVKAFPAVVDYRVELATTATEYANLVDSMGRQGQAFAAYRVALAQREKLAADFPEIATYLNELAWALVAFPGATIRDPERGLPLAKKAVSLAPESATFWNTLGVAYYRAGDLPSAKAALTKSVELRKGGGVVDWLFLAMTCWKMGDKPEARQWYGKAIGLIHDGGGDDGETRRFLDEADALLKPGGGSSPPRNSGPA